MDDLTSMLLLKQRIPKGEYLEEFLKKRGLWGDFKTSRERRRRESEVQALEVFVRERGLKESFLAFRDKRIVAIRLSGQVEG